MFQITDPCADRNLLTPAQLRAAVGVTSDSTELTELGLSVSDHIARTCSVRTDAIHIPTLLSEGVKQVYRPGRGMPLISLGRSNVTEITSVKVDGVVLDIATEIEFTPGGLLYRLRNDRRVSWCGAKVEVEYTAGLLEVPSDLSQIASEYVRLAWAARDRDPTKKSETVEGVGRDEWFEGDSAVTDKLVERLSPYVQYGY